MNEFKKFLIRYEDMILHPEKTFRQLISFTNALSNHEDNIDEEKFQRPLWAFLTALTLGLGAFACLDDPNQEITTYTSETNQTPLSGYVPLKNAIIDGEIAFPSDQSLKTKTLLAVESWPAVKIKLTERPASQRLGLALRIASTQTDKLLEFNCAVELDSAGTASCYDRDSVKRIEGDDHWYDVRKFF